MTTATGPSARTELRPTQRIPRWFLRVPELVFTLHLSRFVPRLVMIVTTGRRTGRPRRVVLDVARDDGRTLWVLAGDGYQARWLKNLLADPRCEIRHRGRRYAALATVTAPDATREAGDLAGDLAVEIYRRRRFYTTVMYLLIGERIHGEKDVRRLSAGTVPVAFEHISPELNADR